MANDGPLEAWLLVADWDLLAARTLLNASPSQPAVAIYHAQQAVEKLLKAALVAEGIHPPHTHDLAALAARVKGRRNEITRIGDLDEITGWATLMRYPDDDPLGVPDMPEHVEIEKVIAGGKALRRTF